MTHNGLQCITPPPIILPMQTLYADLEVEVMMPACIHTGSASRKCNPVVGGQNLGIVLMHVAINREVPKSITIATRRLRPRVGLQHKLSHESSQCSLANHVCSDETAFSVHTCTGRRGPPPLSGRAPRHHSPSESWVSCQPFYSIPVNAVL